MNSQEYRNLSEAYLNVYQELDENRMASRMEKMPTPPAKVGKATHSIKDLAPSKPPTPEEKAKARKALGLDERVLGQDPEMRRARTKDEKRLPPSAGTGYAANQKKSISYMDKLTKKNKIIPGMTHESYDLFDYIMEYLITEGYADTNENALVIMANMSEDWKNSIIG